MLTSKKLVSAFKIQRKPAKIYIIHSLTSEKLVSATTAESFFHALTSFLLVSEYQKQKNKSLTSKKLVSSRQKQKAEGKKLLERRPLDLREHLKGDIFICIYIYISNRNLPGFIDSLMAAL